MLISKLDFDNLNKEQITKLLFEGISDDGNSGDVIFVFGSNKSLKYRLPKAIELYKQDRAKKILFSGGVVWGEYGKTEAELMSISAIKAGIPKEDILMEKDSRHTKENILCSMLVLDRTLMLHNIKRIIVITTAYHMKRTYLTLKTYMPNWIEYSLCPVDCNCQSKIEPLC